MRQLAVFYCSELLCGSCFGRLCFGNVLTVVDVKILCFLRFAFTVGICKLDAVPLAVLAYACNVKLCTVLNNAPLCVLCFCIGEVVNEYTDAETVLLA